MGPGAAGRALAAALARAGWPVTGLVGRTAEAAEQAARRCGVPAAGSSERPGPALDAARILLLTVRDGELAATAQALAGRRSWDGVVVLHVSGALPSSVLAPLADCGAAIGSLHPLMTLPATPSGAPAALPEDTPFFVEGQPAAVAAARRLAKAMGCSCRLLDPEAKALYHAAATIAGNLSTALLAAAGRVLDAAGIEGGAGVLAPLARESVRATGASGAAAALTGPVARGDGRTVEAHLDALSRAGVPDAVRRIHVELSLLAVELAREAGRADATSLARLERRLRAERSRLGSGGSGRDGGDGT